MTNQAIPTWRATLLVARKELVASFRDKQTTLYTILLPIALYPFLFWAMIQGALFVQGRQEHTEVHLGIAAAPDRTLPQGLPAALTHELAPEGDTEHADAPTNVSLMDVETHAQPLDEAGARAWVKASSAAQKRDLAAQGRNAPDAVLWLHGPRVAGAMQKTGAVPGIGDAPRPNGGESAGDGAADTIALDAGADLFFDSTASNSSLAKKRTLKRLPEFARTLRTNEARALGRGPDDLEPFQLDDPKDIAPESRGGAFLLSLLLPMLLVVMTVMGAFYPAVDFTAGERERHTAETTMLLPVPRLAVHQGKILAVCACAVLATSLNLLALGLSAGHLVNMLREGRTIDIVLPVGAFLSVLPLALLFAFIVSAVLTGVAALARTFKEGQALLGPVQMLFIFPAMAGAIPGLELDRVLCFVPVVNVVLAFRALLKGQSMPVEYCLTALTLLVLAVAATWVALRILSRESLVASEKGFSVSQMWRLLRSSGGAR
jgi:ABC-type Na+ efflux pump permease subunit